VYPKDFAFHYSTVYDPTNPVHPWKGYFHLFYIRNKAGLDSIIAHAWTESLGEPWSVDTLAFRPSGVGWDKAKVWAPSIQQVGNLTYMFYTGVDSLGNQSIGYATTEMIGTTNTTWTRLPTPAYRADDTDWALSSGVRQFRDPFIMPDPVHNGRYLLFNTGRDFRFPSDNYYTIGVARNAQGTLGQWQDLGSYEASDHDHLPLPGAAESPMVARDSLTGAWRMFIANAAYDPLGYESTIFLTQNVGDSLTDTRASSWPQRDTLFAYTGSDEDVIGWQACEHLQIGQVHFFAAFEGNGIGITRMHWDSAAQKFIFVYPTVASVPPRPATSTVRFYLSGFRPGAASVRFGIESEGAITPRVDLYDVSGRRVRRLAASRPSRGRAELEWDGRDESGRPVSAGAYFARLYGSNAGQVLRFPILR
jgi:hypothetical protein